MNAERPSKKIQNSYYSLRENTQSDEINIYFNVVLFTEIEHELVSCFFFVHIYLMNNHMFVVLCVLTNNIDLHFMYAFNFFYNGYDV